MVQKSKQRNFSQSNYSRRCSVTPSETAFRHQLDTIKLLISTILLSLTFHSSRFVAHNAFRFIRLCSFFIGHFDACLPDVRMPFVFIIRFLSFTACYEIKQISSNSMPESSGLIVID